MIVTTVCVDGSEAYKVGKVSILRISCEKTSEGGLHSLPPDLDTK
jgi:hypothetical protein